VLGLPGLPSLTPWLAVVLAPAGVFDTAEAAARAYDRESLRLNGRGAITNFPLSGERSRMLPWARPAVQVAAWLPVCSPVPTMQVRSRPLREATQGRGPLDPRCGTLARWPDRPASPGPWPSPSQAAAIPGQMEGLEAGWCCADYAEESGFRII
jgi:hypothetical protein